MKGRRAAAAAAILMATALIGTGCSNLSGTSGKAYITGDGQISVWPVAERGKASTLSGETLDGGTWDIADHLGKPIVVNVWWSNCGPCRTEMPMLQEAATELAGAATFIGVNTRDNSAENGLSFEQALGVSYSSIYSPDGKALLALKGVPRALPSTVVLDSEGRIAATISGEVPSKLTLTQLVTCIAEGNADEQCKVTGKD